MQERIQTTFSQKKKEKKETYITCWCGAEYKKGGRCWKSYDHDRIKQEQEQEKGKKNRA